MADIEWSMRDAVGTIRLNRPRQRNAFTYEMVDEWAAMLRRAATDDSVRVVVVTGEGDKAFCSGVDLGSLPNAGQTPLERKRMLTDRIHQVALGMEALDKPVIAAVNGVAVGAGMDMALMCDLRVAARSARFSEGYVRLGLVPGDGGAYYLPRLVGTAKALELLLTGEFIGAEEAHRIGLVNRVVDDAELPAAVHELAAAIADRPPVTVRMIKRATYQSARTDLRTALDLISSHFAVVIGTEDAQEAVAAFAEGRPATYHGR